MTDLAERLSSIMLDLLHEAMKACSDKDRRAANRKHTEKFEALVREASENEMMMYAYCLYEHDKKIGIPQTATYREIVSELLAYQASLRIKHAQKHASNPSRQ